MSFYTIVLLLNGAITGAITPSDCGILCLCYLRSLSSQDSCDVLQWL